jgi:hypothetical protein
MSTNTETNTIVTNTFIANRVPVAILSLFTKPATNVIHDITPVDAVYYAIRAFTETPNDPYVSTGFADPYTKQVEATMYVLVPDKAAPDWPSMQLELTFLTTLGFAYERDGKYYIHPLAEVLYGPTAYFSDPTQSAAATDLMKVMLHYVLPGLYWRLHYARHELPANIELAHRMDATLRDIAALATSGEESKDAGQE